MQQFRSFVVALAALICAAVLQSSTAAATLGESRKRCLSNELVGNEAVSACTFAIRLKPRDANLFVQRGVAWSKMGDLDYAIGDFSKAIRLNPRTASAYYHRGVARESKGELQDSFSDFKKYGELKPEDPDARLSVERVASAIAEKESALQAKTAVENAPAPAIIEAKAQGEPTKEEVSPAAPASARRDDLFILVLIGLLLASAAVIVLARRRDGAQQAVETERSVGEVERQAPPQPAVETRTMTETEVARPPAPATSKIAPPLAWDWSQYNKE